MEIEIGRAEGPPFFRPTADVSGIDWMVRHGRSLALSVAVNTAASRLCAPKYSNSVHEMIFSNTVADRVNLSICDCGFCFLLLLNTASQSPAFSGGPRLLHRSIFTVDFCKSVA